MRQLPLGVQLGVSLRFDTFALGANAEIVEALQRLAEGTARAPVWIYGPAGSGRSHLLQAACAAAGVSGRSAAYLPLSQMPGQGPGLHAHRQTYETFTVLQGRFEVTWNDDGSGRAVLELFDTVSFPPGVCRAFRNIGDGEGILQVLITGGVHDMTDIDFSEDAKRRIEAVGAGLSREFEKAGFSFTAGK